MRSVLKIEVNEPVMKHVQVRRRAVSIEEVAGGDKIFKCIVEGGRVNTWATDVKIASSVLPWFAVPAVLIARICFCVTAESAHSRK